MHDLTRYTGQTVPWRLQKPRGRSVNKPALIGRKPVPRPGANSEAPDSPMRFTPGRDVGYRPRNAPIEAHRRGGRY